MRINRKKIYNDYSFYKKIAIEANKKGDIERCLNAITGCVELAYRFFLKETFGDDDLEEILYDIGKEYVKIGKKSINDRTEQNNIIFYDSFAQDNRGLTEQYIDALYHNGFNVLFITTNSQFSDKTKLGNKIINKYKYKYEIIDDNILFINKVKKITSVISNFGAEKVFLHLSPYDLFAIILFSQYKGILYRYFINITDHAYWLGKNCIDECIEFRKFGVALSSLVRKIPIKRISLLPYYPVSESIDECDDNNKILDNIRDKFIVITGGTNYKYLDSKHTLLKLILRIFKENTNALLVMVGTSYAGEIYKKFAEKKGFKDRIILLNSTPYLKTLFKKADLYLCSYPMTGGLMAQIAVEQGLPIISYNERFMYHNDISDLISSDMFELHNNFNSFCNQINKLIRDSKYREEYIRSFYKIKYTEYDFRRNLLKIINKDSHFELENYNKKYPKIECLAKKMSNIYISVEKNINKSYVTTINHYNNILKLNTTPTLKMKFKNYLIKKIATIVRYGQQYNEKRNLDMVFSLFKAIGRNFKILEPFVIYGQWNITIGNNFSVQHNFWLEAIDEYNGIKYNPSICIGDNVHIQNNCHIASINSVRIGDNVLMGSNILITDHSHGMTSSNDLQEEPSARKLYSKGEVCIGNNVWIGDNVIILPNVKIGNGCVIGAGTVVTHSFDDMSIIVGNPAKKINTNN